MADVPDVKKSVVSTTESEQIKTVVVLEEHGDIVSCTTNQGSQPIVPPEKHDAGKVIDHQSANTSVVPAQVFSHTDESKIDESDGGNPNDSLSPFCPYNPGNEIRLKTPDGACMTATVLEYFPATLSCVMVIRFVDPSIFDTSECVLKLYDRRFSTQLRRDLGAPAWTPQLEEVYQAFVTDGHADEYFSYWDAERERDRLWSAMSFGIRKRWGAAKLEAYSQWESTTTYEIEKEAYKRMAHLQGKEVPSVFGEVVLDLPGSNKGRDANKEGHEDEQDEAELSASSVDSEDSEVEPQLVAIPGLLLQRIHGFPLTELHSNLPKEHWQSTVDSALNVIHHVHDCGITNRDLAARSFLVDPSTRSVTMIDFGMVSFREHAKDDKEWEWWQYFNNEEDDIAWFMMDYLHEHAGFKLIYKPSERYLRLCYRRSLREAEANSDSIVDEDEDEYVKRHLGVPREY